MKISLPLFTGLFAAVLFCSCGQSLTLLSQTEMQQQDERYSIGVSAQYAGVIQDWLIQAGGCNFPDEPAAKGGSKVFYETIYAAALPLDGSSWVEIGRLPVASAYGVTVASGDALYLIGGQSATGPLKSVLRLTLENGKAVIEQLPDLPCTLDNMTGTVADGRIYLFGGAADGQASDVVLCGDLAQKQLVFNRFPNLPGEPRLQGVSAAIGKDLFVLSGYCPPMEGKDGYLHDTAFKFNAIEGEWESIPMPTDKDGNFISLSGGCAVAADDSHILCVGGVNREVFPIGLNGIEKGETWLSHPVEWYRFNRKVLLFDTKTQQWEELGEMEGTARAGGALVKHGDTFYMMQGEIMPGIRTPKITAFTINP